MDEQPRKRQRELTTQEAFLCIAKEVQNRAGQKLAAEETEDRRFREYFGTGVTTAMIAWSLLVEFRLLPDEAAIIHLLWAMYFLKCYPLTEEGCAAAGSAEKGAVDPKTWRKWVWPTVNSIAELECQVIVFEDRKVRQDHDTHLSIDCTDCRIPQKGPTFSSHKFKNKSGLRYEVALGLLSGEIKWINGPYPCGAWPDVRIFRHSLETFLEPGERVEADDGYIAEAPFVCRIPKAVLYRRSEMDGIQKRAQGRHETINARLKNFAILREMYRHNVTEHGTVFRAVAVLVQLSIKNGDPLFDVNYQVDYEMEDEMEE